MFSEFDTLDALVSEDYYQKRYDVSFVERNFFKYVLFEFYTPTLCRMMLKRQKEFPSCFLKKWPSFIWESKFLPEALLQEKIDDFWQHRAIQVLTGYQMCPIPFSKYFNPQIKTMNLLSRQGEDLLEQLKSHKDNLSDTMKEKTVRAANKFLLDLNNFISFPEIEKAPFTAQKVRMTVSLSTGCYNQCVHCGYEAKPVLSHMPYPIFLRLVEAFGHRLGGTGLNGQMIYADSDPMSYYDPIIGADAADVVHFLKTTIPLQNRENISFLTKGILFSQDELTVAKMAMGKYSMTLSVVLLPGEAVQKNIKRILRTIDVYIQNGGDCDALNGRYFSFSGRESVSEIDKMGLNFIKAKPCMNGKWVSYVKKHFPFCQASFYPTGFAEEKNLVIKSDGKIWLNRLNPKTGCFDWIQLDNIFNYQSLDPVQRNLKTVRSAEISVSTVNLLKEMMHGIDRI